MNSKQYQRIDITIPSGVTHYNVQEQLRSDYKYATGLFFFCDKPLTGVTCGVKIDGNEILPIGSELDLFRWTNQISRNEALWDFSDDRIESSQKTIDIHLDIPEGGYYAEVRLTLMVLLKN